MMRRNLATIIASCLLGAAEAATVRFDWEVSWVTAAPDGFSRPVIGVNGRWPCPAIEASVGDTIVVKLTNNLGNQTTGLHFHGINQVSTNFMDGPSMVTQCPLPPNMTMTYQFTADAPGTFWWHSHNMGQYPDGLRGVMIVRDPSDPFAGQYDEENTLTLSDWYHEQTIPLAQAMFSTANTQHRPPLPDSVVVNDGGSGQYTFERGKTYRFRIISFAALASFFVHFDSHDMEVIAIDGAYVTKTTTFMLRVAPAQRYDILVSAIERDNRNFPFLIAMDRNPDFSNPELPRTWDHNYTGQLAMDPEGDFTRDVVDAWRPHDDSHFEPLPGGAILPSPDKTIELTFTTCFDDAGIPRACFNGSPYVDQKVPSLYTAATVGEANTNPLVYGNVHPYIVSSNDYVDIVINNADIANHPFHLHGHHFQVLTRPRRGTGAWPGADRASLNQNPPMRDTVEVWANSYAVLRFKADNPGVYLFHCHIEWHVEMGLTATIIEAPERLRGLDIPGDHIEMCRRLRIPSNDNAGGNLEDPLDTSNFDVDPPLEYIGATYGPPQGARRFRRGRVLGGL